MSKELFEALMKEFKQNARACGYTTGAAAGDFLATFYYTIESEFLSKYKEGDECAVKDLSDFGQYFRAQLNWLRNCGDID